MGLAVECIPVYALRGNPLLEIEPTSSPFQSLPFSPTHPPIYLSTTPATPWACWPSQAPAFLPSRC